MQHLWGASDLASTPHLRGVHAIDGGDPSAATLPYRRLATELTSVRWNLSADVHDARRELVPDVPVRLTAAAHFAGEDPALETVLRLIHAPVP